MLIITAPGQGAQTPGFLAPWLELPGVAERLGACLRAGRLRSRQVRHDRERRRDQGHGGGAAAARGGRDRGRFGPVQLLAVRGSGGDVAADAAAGHSVGELAAGVIAGVLTADDAMRLVAVRGRAMAAAAATEPTGMTAVLGGDQEAVLATIARHGLTPANVNAAGQIVAAGTLAELDAFAADPPAGARLRPLAGRGGLPHPRTWPRPWPPCGTRRPTSRSPIRPSPCCPTPTEPRSPPARSGWSASSPRSPRRCAGICACGPWPTSA